MSQQLMQVRLKDIRDDRASIRQTFAHFPSGVAALATERHGQKHVVVASSFMVGVSLEPCLVAVAVQRNSETWPVLREAETIGVSVLSSTQTPIVRQLSGTDRARRFDQIAVETKTPGGVFLADASLWLETSVHSELDAGDHVMVLLEVRRVGVDERREPLVWHGSKFRAVSDAPPLAV